MDEKPLRCARCNGEMEQGFIVDTTHGGHFVSRWMRGAPKKSFIFVTQIDKNECIPIGTYRCKACGYLESYAQPDFDAK